MLGPPLITVGSLRRRAAARAGSPSAGVWAMSPSTAASRTRRSAVPAGAGMSWSARPAAAVSAAPASGFALGLRAARMALMRVFRRFFLPYQPNPS